MEADKAVIDELIMRVENSFEVYSIKESEKALIFEVYPIYTHEESFSILLEQLKETDYLPYYRRKNGGYRLIISKKIDRKGGHGVLLHIILMIATIFTMTLAGYMWWADGDVFLSVVFALSLMGILGLHELGHALTARKHGIKATLPYFIPVPPPFPFGTFGAVISINSPVINRKSLLEVGVAGPTAGFLVALPIVIVGLKFSHIVSLEETELGGVIFTMPLLFQILSNVILGEIPPNHIIIPHPLAIAGWAGLFVTSLNLLPMGQLDGGHIIRGLFPVHFKKIYYGVAVVLLMLGLLWPGYILWVFLSIFITKMEHPGPLDDVSELEDKHRFYAVVALIVLILSFMPVPIVSA